MATAHKLPSGNWRVLAYAETINGKRIYKSFTASTKKQAEYDAALYAVRKKRAGVSLTVGEAIDRYISSKSAVLSPKTIREYKGIRKRAFLSIMRERVDRLTDEQIQIAVNEYSNGRSNKTVRNAMVLLSSSVRLFKDDFKPVVTLPQRIKQPFIIPSDDAVKVIIDASKGELRVAILMYAVLGMRRSEICALEWKDIKKNTITINKAMVLDEDRNYIIKTTKSISSTRELKVPVFVMDAINALPCKSKRVVNIMPENLTNQFIRLATKNGFVGRLHDLRHYFASTLLEMGVPDIYTAQRMGHASMTMLKQVYQHVKETKDKEIDSAIEKRMSELFS